MSGVGGFNSYQDLMNWANPQIASFQANMSQNSGDSPTDYSQGYNIPLTFPDGHGGYVQYVAPQGQSTGDGMSYPNGTDPTFGGIVYGDDNLPTKQWLGDDGKGGIKVLYSNGNDNYGQGFWGGAVTGLGPALALAAPAIGGVIGAASAGTLGGGAIAPETFAALPAGGMSATGEFSSLLAPTGSSVAGGASGALGTGFAGTSAADIGASMGLAANGAIPGLGANGLGALGNGATWTGQGTTGFEAPSTFGQGANLPMPNAPNPADLLPRIPNTPWTPSLSNLRTGLGLANQVKGLFSSPTGGGTGASASGGSGGSSGMGGLQSAMVGNQNDTPIIQQAYAPQLPQLGQLSSYQGTPMNIRHMADGGLFDFGSWGMNDVPWGSESISEDGTPSADYSAPSSPADSSPSVADDYMANGMGSPLATDSPAAGPSLSGGLSSLWNSIKGADPKTVQTIIGAIGALSSLSGSRHPTAQSVMGQRASLLSGADSFNPSAQQALNAFVSRPAASAVANPYGSMNPAQIAAMPQVGPSPIFFHHAEGGMAGTGTPMMGNGALMHVGPGMVHGPGDGQSDDVNAMLAKNEFVIPADVVAALGNGSSDAGGQALHGMMQHVRDHVRNGPVDAIPPKALSPLQHMAAGMKGKK